MSDTVIAAIIGGVMGIAGVVVGSLLEYILSIRREKSRLELEEKKARIKKLSEPQRRPLRSWKQEVGGGGGPRKIDRLPLEPPPEPHE